MKISIRRIRELFEKKNTIFKKEKKTMATREASAVPAKEGRTRNKGSLIYPQMCPRALPSSKLPARWLG